MKSLLYASIVSNILALSDDAIHIDLLLTNINGVVAVLINETLSLLQVLLFGLGFPPVNKITYNN